MACFVMRIESCETGGLVGGVKWCVGCCVGGRGTAAPHAAEMR
jgi:hypothetical protein